MEDNYLEGDGDELIHQFLQAVCGKGRDLEEFYLFCLNEVRTFK